MKTIFFWLELYDFNLISFYSALCLCKLHLECSVVPWNVSAISLFFSFFSGLIPNWLLQNVRQNCIVKTTRNSSYNDWMLILIFSKNHKTTMFRGHIFKMHNVMFLFFFLIIICFRLQHFLITEAQNVMSHFYFYFQHKPLNTRCQKKKKKNISKDWNLIHHTMKTHTNIKKTITNNPIQKNPEI